MILKKNNNYTSHFVWKIHFAIVGSQNTPTLVLYDTILLFYTINFKIFLKSIKGYFYYV